jgi:hypothetical protein
MTGKFTVKNTEQLFDRFNKAGLYITSLNKIIQNEGVILSEDDIAAWEKKVDAAIKALNGLKTATIDQIRKNPVIESVPEDLSKDIEGDPF